MVFDVLDIPILRQRSRETQDRGRGKSVLQFPIPNLVYLLNADGELEYQVHQKPNQQLKYLYKGSTHTNATFNKITSGIFYRLAKLTSRTKKNAQMKIYERYQGHAKALSKAGLAPENISDSE